MNHINRQLSLISNHSASIQLAISTHLPFHWKLEQKLAQFKMFVIVLLATFLLSLWIKARKHKLSLFERHGIPGPKPNLIFGNILEMSSTGSIHYHRKLMSEYGLVCGYYLGTVPYLIVGDKELLHEILVTNSRVFIQRPRRIPGGVNPDPKRKRMLAHLPPDEWQVVRKTLSGMFNPPKVKPHIPNLTRIVDVFMATLASSTASNPSDAIELGSLYEFLSLDLIGQTAFGRKAEVQGNPQDDLLVAVRDKYSKPMLAPLNVLTLCFPEFGRFLQPLRVAWQKVKEATGFAGEKNATLWEVAYKCLEESFSPELNPDGSNLSQFHILQKGGIQTELMIAYCVNAFQGDYENVTTALSFMTHLLIDHPEVQDKIREEVSQARKELDGEVDSSPENTYAFYSSLKYMESVIYETLRLWPQTSFVRRSPSEDYPFVNDEGKKIVIPKGVHIQVAHYEAQRLKDVWGEDADKFMPERFYEGGDRDKVSPNCVTYQGFGSGPRHCMGQKFATLILKMTMTTLLEKYQLERSHLTGNIEDHGRSLMSPVSSFHAKLTPRQ